MSKVKSTANNFNIGWYKYAFKSAADFLNSLGEMGTWFDPEELANEAWIRSFRRMDPSNERIQTSPRVMLGIFYLYVFGRVNKYKNPAKSGRDRVNLWGGEAVFSKMKANVDDFDLVDMSEIVSIELIDVPNKCKQAVLDVIGGSRVIDASRENGVSRVYVTRALKKFRDGVRNRYNS